MCDPRHEMNQVSDPELTNCRIGVVAGHVVSIIGDWRDARHQTHYSVRLPNGEINYDVHQDDISFDRNLIRSISQ